MVVRVYHCQYHSSQISLYCIMHVYYIYPMPPSNRFVRIYGIACHVAKIYVTSSYIHTPLSLYRTVGLPPVYG